MALLTLKVMASLLQIHGPGATVQSDHQGIQALLGDLRTQGQEQQGHEQQGHEQQGHEQQGQEQGVVPEKPVVTQAAFRRGFARGPAAGAFRRAGSVAPGGAFRRGFARAY